MESPVVFDSSFFMKELRFKQGCLDVEIGDESHISGIITFDYVRAFVFFKESDFWTELSRYSFENILSVRDEEALGVFKILKNPLSELIIQGRLDGESPLYYWISTPDECLEVVTFEIPIITQLLR